MKTNTAEGASASGVTVTTGNSGGGSGDAFAVVAQGSSASLTYDTAAAFHGIYGFRVTKTAGNASQTLAELREGSGDTSVGGTLYVRPTGSIANDASVLGMQIRSTTDAVMGRLQIGTGDVIKIYNQASLQLTGSVALTLNGSNYYRLELDATGLGSTGTWTGRVYLGDSQTPLDTISGSITTVGGLTSDRMRFGNLGSSNIQSYDFDDPRFNPGGASPGPTGFSGTVTLSGGGTLTYSSTITTSGSAALAGAGTLAAAGSPSAGGALALSGAGTLAATGRPGAAGTLSTSGAGTLTGAGTPAVSGGLTISGTGTLGRTGVPTATGTLSTAGSGTLTPSGTPVTSGTRALSGTGTLALSGTGSSDGGGSINLSGAGTLTSTGTPSVSGTLALGGAGSLGSVGVPATSGARALSGAGTLSLSGAPGGFAGSVSLSGSGALSGAGTLAVAGALGLSGIGALSLFGQPAGALTGALALSGEGTLASTARVGTSGGLQLGGIGYFAKAPGVQVGFTPSNEMVAVAWLKSAVPYLGNRVATELPSDNSSWSASGFTTVATTGGTPNTEVPVNEPVMSIDSWGVTPSSGRPPWNLAAQPAEAIKAAAVDHGMIPRILTMPTGFNLVRVFCVIPLSEPRRINGDAAAYAHYQQDLEIRWVKT